MTKAFLTFATLALFCFTSSLAQAQNNGVVSVAITNTTSLNGQSNSQSEFVEFDYEAVEWSNEAGNLENEWSYEEAGVGEFELTNQAGDVILIKAHNDNTLNQDLGAILGTVVGTSALGGVSTVADNIGNSVSATQDQLQNANVNNVASTVVSNAENVANNAGAVIGTITQGVQNVPENAAQAVENAGQDAQNAYNAAANNVNNLQENASQAVENAGQDVQNAANNAANSAQNVYNDAANNVNNLQENASQAVNNAAETVSSNAQNAVNEASNAAGNVAGAAANAANSATETYNNAVNGASNAVGNVANSATESYNNAVNAAQNQVESVQNGLSGVRNAYNQGFLSGSN